MGKAYLVNDHCDENYKEQKINKNFCWNDEKWLIPSVFLSESKLTIDFCREAEPEKILAFIEKWNLMSENKKHFTNEEIEQIDAEHPLQLHIRSRVIVNGKELKSGSGSGVNWIPASCLRERGAILQDQDALCWIKRYELDAEMGWSFWKSRFRLEEPIDEIRSLELELIPERISIPGPYMTNVKAGERVEFVHPVTGKNHVLLVQSDEARTLTQEQFGNDDFEYPLHLRHLTFSLEPELSREEFTVCDCAEGDRPRKKNSAKKCCSSMAVSIISVDRANELHSAVSSLYFEPSDYVEWRMVFHINTKEKIKVKLI